MPVDGRGAAADLQESAPLVLAVAALDFEAAALRRHAGHGDAGDDAAGRPLRRARVVQSGPGPERAAAAAAAGLGSGAAALLSWGVAGGLVRGVEPGTVLVPRIVLTPGGASHPTDAGWRAALVAALRAEFPLREEPLLSGDAVLETPAAKADAAAASGAIGVDTESAAIAGTASRARVPFAAIRVIVDAADDALPAGAGRWVDVSGNRRLAPALEA